MCNKVKKSFLTVLQGNVQQGMCNKVYHPKKFPSSKHTKDSRHFCLKLRDSFWITKRHLKCGKGYSLCCGIRMGTWRKNNYVIDLERNAFTFIQLIFLRCIFDRSSQNQDSTTWPRKLISTSDLNEPFRVKLVNFSASGLPT